MPDDSDVPARIAALLRRVWGVYAQYDTAIATVVSVVAIVATVASVAAPDVLDAAAAAVAAGASSDITHTLLLGVLIGTHAMGVSETDDVRADGGRQDWRQPLLALLFAFMGATVGAGIAERWSVPGFFIGLAIFLWFFAETE